MVLRPRPQHGGAADIDILHNSRFVGTRSNGFLERVEIDHQQVDAFDPMRVHCRRMVLRIADGEQSAVNRRMQGLHTPVHDFRKPSHVANVRHRQSCITQRFRTAAGGEQFHALVRQRPTQIDQPRLVENGQQRAAHGHAVGGGDGAGEDHGACRRGRLCARLYPPALGGQGATRYGPQMSDLTVLGIETSCDETAASVVRLIDGKPLIASNIVASQIEDHAPFGGVVPEIAARAHLDSLDGIIAAAMKVADATFADLDGIAVTSGPGLAGGLIVGSMTARAIAMVHDKPLLTINHLEGHALTARLTDDVNFPYLLLLVSGGHTQILRVDGVGEYTRIATTIDDALGEAFDKTAKLLGLPYPGGPAVEKAARDGDPKAFTFPRPLSGRDTLDMSFSGLKTAVRNTAMQTSDPNISDICASFQAAVGDVLVDRLERAMDNFGPPSALVVAGGVAANAYLRDRLEAVARTRAWRWIAPPAALCTDNAAMIAWAGLERLRAGLVEPDAGIRPRWPLDADASAGFGSGRKGRKA